MRMNKLSNTYMGENPVIILLNSTCAKRNKIIRLYGYNINLRNYMHKGDAGVVVAKKRNIKYK